MTRRALILADLDLRRGLHAKRWFDAVGHYSGASSLGMTERPLVAPEDGEDGSR